MFPLVRRAVIAAIAVTAAFPMPVQADNGAGAYLAGRQAQYRNDYSAADRFYSQALTSDSANPALLESVILARLSLGELDRAYALAQDIEALGLRSQAASIVVTANLIAQEKFDDLLARNPEEQGIGPLVDGLLTGWALMGTGAVSKALEQFDNVAGQDGLREFALFHKAMALASVGDFEGADEILAADDARVARISRRAALARTEILSQLDRNTEAQEMLMRVFGTRSDPAIEAYQDRLAAGEQLPFTFVRSPVDGMAEVFYSVGSALNNEAASDYVLVYSRTASFLRADHIDALLLSAELLDALGQYDLSVATYKMVPKGSPDYHAAELGRAEALRRAAKPDAAIEVLEQLAQDYSSQPVIHSSLGDLFRQQEEYVKAVNAYDRALDNTDETSDGRWFLHYARGISYERLKNWDKAEADFRAALVLYPDQPQVLNYLGYSLVERHEKLDEALDMIQRAVAARPDSGFIVDSLGWVLFKLGRYDEAVEHMERAVELMPVDPIVNDHLGDVYWSVGRAREAEFQWKRALSFVDPEQTDDEVDPDRIRRKIEVGLDAVLAQEGADPLKVADGD